MKLFILILLLFHFAHAGCSKRSSQILLVTSENWNSSKATLQRFEKKNKIWSRVGDEISVNIGRNGLGWGRSEYKFIPENNEPLKKEGDGRAPAGIFKLSRLFGYAKTPPLKSGLPYTQATDELLCIDDANSPFYNQITPKQILPKPNSFEVMRRSDSQYELGVIVEHNSKTIKRGAGSCIFLHVQKESGSPTSGCTSMSYSDLTEITNWLESEKSPLLVQFPKIYSKRFLKLLLP